MPALSPTMKMGTISKWLKKEGDKIASGEPICAITTDKSTVEYESMEDGYLRKIVIKDGEQAEVNQGIAVVTATPNEDISSYKLEEPNLVREVVQKEEKREERKAEEKRAAPVSQIAFEPVPPNTKYVFPAHERGEMVAASPLAKKIAKEKGLDLRSVRGSGPHGRILAKDLEVAQKSGPVSFGDEGIPTLPPGTYEEEPLTPMRKVIGERLQAAKISIPHYYVTDEIKASRMVDLRKQLMEMGQKLTYNDFVLRACALALRKHPEVNSGFNSAKNTIIRFKTVDISLAVAIPDGLITPIIFHADYKSIAELSEEAKILAKKARDNALRPEEYQGGSFTVSNLGMFGIKSFDAVINPPQAAILAIGGIIETPIVEEGRVVAGHLLTLTLSADHRVIDGASAAGFLKTVKQFLENPASLVI